MRREVGDEVDGCGGGGGEASGEMASVTGGRDGLARGFASTVIGGLLEVIEEEYGIAP